ncbi:hypothetical protein [Pectobacterium versatile]
MASGLVSGLAGNSLRKSD